MSKSSQRQPVSKSGNGTKIVVWVLIIAVALSIAGGALMSLVGGAAPSKNIAPGQNYSNEEPL